MKRLWQKVKCYFGLHEGIPSGPFITCNYCDCTKAIEDVVLWRVGRHDEGQPSMWWE